MKNQHYRTVLLFLRQKLLSITLTAALCMTALPLTVQASVATAPDLSSKVGGLDQTQIQYVSKSDTSEVFQEGMDSVGSSIDATAAAEYEQYGTSYYYNQLSDAQQTLWDDLNELCLYYLTGTESISQTSNGYLTRSVSYSNLSRNDAVTTLLLFKYSNPQFYFLDLQPYMYYTSTTGTISFSVFQAFANGTSRASATSQMFSAVQSAISYMSSGSTDVQKEKLAHDWIVNRVSYADSTYDQVAYSVFVSGTTVCAGYSQAMELLMNAADIDCAVQTSDSHEWNIIRLNDSWYYLDLTWDDMDGSQGYVTIYNYFNRNSAYILNNDVGDAHVAENLYSGLKPSFTHDSKAGTSDIGSIYTPSSKWNAPSISVSNGAAVLSAESGTTIYYTTDGSTPSVASSKAKKYKGSFTCSDASVVSAIAVGDNKWDSNSVGTSSGTDSASMIVTFNSMGGSAVSNRTVTYGATVAEPTAPTRAGYTFAGWYKDTAYANPYYFSSPVIRSMTLYAKWAGKTYKVTLDANGGYISKKSQSAKTIKVVNGSVYSGLVTPKQAGYVFCGWYTKKSGGKKITTSTIVDLTGKRTFYARWTESGSSTRQAKISSLSTSQGGFTVVIGKISTATGYQLRYSTAKSMNPYLSLNLTDNSKTVTSLVSGTTYYVQVRMYQKDSVSGDRYYGKWSTIKKITVS